MLETYVLHVTKECNMNCTYCYEKDKSSKYEWNDIKVLLDDIIKYNKEFNLEFLGGEPCLRVDLIEKTIDYLNSVPDVSVKNFTITTNGTIVTQQLIDLLKTNSNVRWSASIDGNRLMNFMRIIKENKMNSYDTVVKNFRRLRDELGDRGNKQLSCHLVTHHYNIGYLNDGITDLYNVGFRNFGIGTIESTLTIDDAYCDSFIKQCQILSDRIKVGKLPGIYIGIFNELKPEDDKRHYIRDETGKVILETYGRANNDIKDTEEYKTISSSSPISDKINYIRKTVYNYHNAQ